MQSSNHPARKLKQLLKTYTMSVQELSEKLGITLESFREILDERAWPTAHLLRRVCSLFGVGEAMFGEFLREDFDFTSPPTQPAAAAAFKGKPPAGPAGRSPGPARGLRLRRKKKLDLTELFVRHQVLFELLVDKKVFTREEYQMRMEIIRAKIIERRAAAKTR